MDMLESDDLGMITIPDIILEIGPLTESQYTTRTQSRLTEPTWNPTLKS